MLCDCPTPVTAVRLVMIRRRHDVETSLVFGQLLYELRAGLDAARIIAAQESPAYAGDMTQTSAEILETAKGLSREERAELALGLLATLGEHDVSESARLEALRSAVDRGVSGLDAGQGVDVASGEVRGYLRERGRLATERADAKTV